MINNSAMFLLYGITIYGFNYMANCLDIRKETSVSSSWYPDNVQENFVSDDIRCFCNLPNCVLTGYMCRTKRSGNESGCFSEIANKIPLLEPTVDTTVTRHGCIEQLIASNQRFYCDKSLTKLKLKLAAQKHKITNAIINHQQQQLQQLDNELLLSCCHEDMCNHIDNPENQKLKLDLAAVEADIDFSSNIDSKYHEILSNSDSNNHHNLLQDSDYKNQNGISSKFDSSQLKLSSGSSSSLKSTISASSSATAPLPKRSHSTITTAATASTNDDWFRIATIAVPICGAVILFSLIAIAIKILRTTTDRSASLSLKLDNSSIGNCGNGGNVISSSINSGKNFINHKKFVILDQEAQIIKSYNQQQQQQLHAADQQHPHNQLLGQYFSYDNNSCSSNSEICNNRDNNSLLNSTNSNNFYCDKKNEARAKINQLLNIQYSLLPQQSSLEDNLFNTSNNKILLAAAATTTTIPSSGSISASQLQTQKSFDSNHEKNNPNMIENSSNFLNNNSKVNYKTNNNINNNNNNNNNCSSSNNIIIDKHNKIYAKDTLSPISENNWTATTNSDNNNSK